MGRAPTIIVYCCCACLAAFPASWAGTSTEKRIEQLEKENAELRAMIEALRQRLESLERLTAAQRKPPEVQAPPAPTRLEELEERLQVLEDLEEKHEKGWIRSLRRKWLEIGGEIELEYRDTQNETESRADVTRNPYGQFQIDHVRLSPRVRFSDDLIFEADFDAGQQAEADLQEAYLTWRHLPLDSELLIGQHKKFFRPRRKTEVYPLAGRAFWRDRDLGVTWRAEYDPLYSYVSVTNGLRLNDDEIGEDESFPIVADDLEFGDPNENKEVGLGLGWKRKSKRWGRLDVMIFGIWAKLSDEDIRFLRRLPGYGLEEEDDDRNRYGANVEYQRGGWTLFSQYINSEDGGLDRDAWYIQASYKLDIKRKYLQSVEPLVRYGELDLNLEPFPNNSMIWDRQQWTTALLFEIMDDIYVRTEYTFNDEETGDGDIRNNEALVQLELRF